MVSRSSAYKKIVLAYKDLEAGRLQLMWTLSTAPTWKTENVITIIIIIIIIIIVVVVVVVVGDDTYYWAYLSSDHPF